MLARSRCTKDEIRRPLFRLALLLLPLLLALTGCKRPSPAKDAVVPVSENVTSYEVRGVVHKIHAESGKAVIAHENIPGYMEAMTMEFTAGAAAELAGIRPGDVLAFRLHVTDQRSWINGIRKTGSVPVESGPPPPAADGEPLPPGTPLPDCRLTDSRGAPLHLRDFKGRALAITFIFTRCPLPDFCPRMNAHFAATQRALAAANPQADWHLLCISLDPEYDTPARLAEYAARLKPDPARWTFATGALAEIETFSRSCGLEVARDGALPAHNLRTVVIGPDGRVSRTFTGNGWKPGELVAEMQKVMTGAR